MIDPKKKIWYCNAPPEASLPFVWFHFDHVGISVTENLSVQSFDQVNCDSKTCIGDGIYESHFYSLNVRKLCRFAVIKFENEIFLPKMLYI